MTNVVMPQMGESIAEGTIVRWIKKVGDQVDKDEPLFEISTDKVDAEIPAPDAGTLLEIRVHEGETVPVHTVVAIIGTAGARVVDEARTAPTTVVNAAPTAHEVIAPFPVSARQPAIPDARQDARSVDRLHAFSSPVVRSIARAHGIDISQLRGSGVSGRVT